MSAIIDDPGITFHTMQESDLPAVMEIERSAYEFCWTEGIFRDCMRVGYQCRLMFSGDELAGYGVMSVAAGEAHVLNVCVRPELQGRGHGRRIMQHLIDLASRLHTDTLLLEVRPSNVPAIRLYESMGFNQVGIRKDYYPARDGREDALIFAMSLSQA